MVRKTDQELNTDRKKPCGYMGFCPLIDEHRLFYEGNVALVQSGVSREDSYKYVNVMVSKWCKRLDAIGLHPDLVTCRAAAEIAGENADQGMTGFIKVLYKLTREYEKSQGQNLADLADKVLAAPF